MNDSQAEIFAGYAVQLPDRSLGICSTIACQRQGFLKGYDIHRFRDPEGRFKNLLHAGKPHGKP